MEHKRIFIYPDANPTLVQLELFEIPIETASLKFTYNYNKMIDSGYFETSSIDDTHYLHDVIKEGSHIFFNDTDKSHFIIDEYKKILVSKLGSQKKHKYQIKIIDKSIILHKIFLPNRSLTQPVVGNLKKTTDMIEQYLNMYFNEYDGKNIVFDDDFYFFDIPENAEEFKWIQPSLYEVVDDLIQKNFKMVVYSKREDDKYYFSLKNIVGFSSEMNHNIITNVEINNSLDNTPQQISSIIDNVAGLKMKEFSIPQTTDIGVVLEDDENTRWETAYKLNRPIKARIKGFLSREGGIGVEGHDDGYIEMDITNYIQAKEIWDVMPINQKGFYDALNKNINFTKQGNLYYEVGSKYINGLLKIVTGSMKVFSGEKFVLTMIMNHIWKYNRNHIKSSTIFPVFEKPSNPIQTEITEQQINRVTFHNNDARKLTLDIEYEVVDTFRYDTTKKIGFGTAIQNQSEGYVNLDKFIDHQNELIKKIGFEEAIIMGTVKNENELPILSQTYNNDRMIVQITPIYKYNSIDFMAIATSKHNRVDDGMVIHNKRRYFDIVPMNDSIERFDFFEVMVDEQNEIDNIPEINVALLESYDSNNNKIAQGMIKIIANKREHEKIFYGKTLDNKYLGKTLIKDSYFRLLPVPKTVDIEITDGIFYTSEYTGEFYKMDITLGYLTLSGFTEEFPKNVDKFEPKTESFTIWNKDSSERISFGIRYYLDVYEDIEKIPEIERLPDFKIQISQNYQTIISDRVWDGFGFDLEFDQEYEISENYRIWNSYMFDLILRQQYKYLFGDHIKNTYSFILETKQHYLITTDVTAKNSYMFNLNIRQAYELLDTYIDQNFYRFDMELKQHYIVQESAYSRNVYIFEISTAQNYELLDEYKQEADYSFDADIVQNYNITYSDGTQSVYTLDLEITQNYSFLYLVDVNHYYDFQMHVNQNYGINSVDKTEYTYSFDINIDQSYNIIKNSGVSYAYNFEVNISQNYEIE